MEMSFRRGGAGCLGSDQPRSMWRKRSGRIRWAPHYRILGLPRFIGRPSSATLATR